MIKSFSLNPFFPKNKVFAFKLDSHRFLKKFKFHISIFIIEKKKRKKKAFSLFDVIE